MFVSVFNSPESIGPVNFLHFVIVPPQGKTSKKGIKTQKSISSKIPWFGGSTSKILQRNKNVSVPSGERDTRGKLGCELIIVGTEEC